MFDVRKESLGPGWVAQLVRVLSPYTKVAGLISGQDTDRKRPVNA